MNYMYECARAYIQEAHANGPYVWGTMEQDIQFVLTHPNGWGGSRQAQLRLAAVRAGLVPDTKIGRTRVQFVSEGERVCTSAFTKDWWRRCLCRYESSSCTSGL